MIPQLSEDHLNVLYLVHVQQDLFTGCHGLVALTARLNQLSDLQRAGLISAAEGVADIAPARLAEAIGLAPMLKAA